jgi:hypothetical protein
MTWTKPQEKENYELLSTFLLQMRKTGFLAFSISTSNRSKTQLSLFSFQHPYSEFLCHLSRLEAEKYSGKNTGMSGNFNTDT